MAAPASARTVQPAAPLTEGAPRWRVPSTWIALLLVFGSALAALRTPYRFGANQTADSAVYFSAADSPTRGIQLTTNVSNPPGTPLTHYPPLYPVLLASAKAAGVSFLRAAAVIDFLAYFLSCLGVYWFLSRSEKPVCAIAAVLLLLCAGPVDYTYSLVGPDGPAIALMILSLCLVSEYLRKGNRRTLVLCGIALATALLLRYVCAAFIGAACFVVLWGERAAWSRKLRSALLLATIASVPLGCVLFVNRLLAGSATDRHVQLHLVNLTALGDLAASLSAAFLPYQLPVWLHCVALAAVSVCATRSAWGRQRVGQSIRIVAIFLAAYLVFLLVSVSLFDAATPFDDRILAPAVALICILVALLLSAVWQRDSWPGKASAAGVLLAVLFLEASHARAVLTTTAQAGSADRLRAEYAPVLPAIQALPEKAAIYSNVPFDIYLLTGRNARTLPRLVGYTDLKSQPVNQIDARLREMREQVERTGGLIIYKIRPATLWDEGLLSEQELKRRIPKLDLLQRQSGFAAYRIPSADR